MTKDIFTSTDELIKDMEQCEPYKNAYLTSEFRDYWEHKYELKGRLEVFKAWKGFQNYNSRMCGFEKSNYNRISETIKKIEEAIK